MKRTDHLAGTPFTADAAVELLAAALFCTTVRPEDRPTAPAVRRTVCRRLGPGRIEAATCLATWSRASARSDSDGSRMTWCRRTVTEAFPVGLAIPPIRRNGPGTAP
ncbi:hypothetical protein [Streptomyces sp. NPDC002851]